ncbi:MAG: aminodeoxychorismate synthase component I [Rhizorhabdus sp.]|uniref:aminodeoxychorismate synthase component I n=1 Tax=Rhizorhabdus sp. TaxID=1968843 RepID=UPI001B712592|nr:aminodeoxychorismate synthase component I [Rhizorhabdus sp.]MBP8230980.1 aminodeoxychorismate synthase component I [Rhizorhabdus sp.]
MPPVPDLSGSFAVLAASGRNRLYAQPVDTIVAWTGADVDEALTRLDAALTSGLHAAGCLTFEAGLALEPRLAALARPLPPESGPLLWFGLFEGFTDLPDDWTADLAAQAAAGAAEPLIERRAYAAAFAEVQRLIAAGDVYQINLTFPCRVPVSGDPVALYAALRDHARAPHGGILRTDDRSILSFSPELFFRRDGQAIECRPMKGTATRGASAEKDRLAVAALSDDPKQQAENLMIVDLLRNDIARICLPGSVSVPRLFDVETYPTIHQMTSTVTGTLREGIGAEALLRALFPCGSITGAPKIRATEAILAVEPESRGIYTGSIGWFAPDGSAEFNVAIRTLDWPTGAPFARYGIGSGVVADSSEASEWRECLAKAEVLTRRQATPKRAQAPRRS